jgi:hypothetical protein
MQSGKRLTLKDYFAKHTRTHKNHKNTNVELLYIVNCQVQLFLDNMVLANQNAKLTGPDQGFLVSRLVLTLKPWERGWCKFENNGAAKKFSAKESPKIIKECWTKVLMVEIKRKRFKDHFWSENR